MTGAAGYGVVPIRGAGNAQRADVAKTIKEGIGDGPLFLAGDRDEAGTRFNASLGAALTELSAKVYVLALPDGAKDLADWREQRPNTFAAELHAAVANAPIWTADEDAPDPYNGDAAELLDAVRATLERFTFIREVAWYDVLTLWIASSYFIRASKEGNIAPRHHPP